MANILQADILTQQVDGSGARSEMPPAAMQSRDRFSFSRARRKTQERRKSSGAADRAQERPQYQTCIITVRLLVASFRRIPGIKFPRLPLPPPPTVPVAIWAEMKP